MPRRLLPLLLIIVLAGLSLLVALRWGRPRVVAAVGSTIASPVAGDGGAIAWIDQESGGARLRVRSGRGSVRDLLSGKVIGGVAVRGGEVFTTVADEGGGAAQLQALPVQGGRARNLATVFAPAKQLMVGDGQVFWLTGSKPVLPAAPYLVAAGPVSAIAMAPEKGGTPSLVASSLDGGQAELVGIAGGRLYWLEYQRQGGEEVTAIMRRAVAGGPVEALAREPGRRSAVLWKERLAWTAPSPEAAPFGIAAAVKIMPLSGGQAKVVADWLGPKARLLAGDAGLYAQDETSLWRVGEARGTQHVVYDRSYGAALPALVGDDEFALSYFGRRRALTERGVTWTAKLRHALGLGA